MVGTGALQAGASTAPRFRAGPQASAAGKAGFRTQGFKIYNLSSQAFELTKVSPGHSRGILSSTTDLMEFDEQPYIGDVLQPGAMHDFELRYYPGYIYGAQLTYHSPGDHRYLYSANIRTWSFANESTCHVTAPLRCTADGTHLTITNAPGTVINIPATNAVEQGNVLKLLCLTDASLAKCHFSPTREIKTQTPSQIVGNAYVNCTNEEQETRFRADNTVGNTNSVDVKVKLGTELTVFGQKIQASITTAYGHEWTQEHTFSQDETLKVAPRDAGWVASTAPIYRDFGTFTVTLGDTTWQLHDAYFDTPDPTRAGDFVVDSRTLTDKEYEAICTHREPSGGLTTLPPF